MSDPVRNNTQHRTTVFDALFATAGVTLRGFVRDRSLIAAIALVWLALVFGATLAPASVGSSERLVTDIGWAAAGLFGWLLALVHGSGLTDRGGVIGAAQLARPVSPATLLAGRFAGLAAGMAIYAAATTATLLVWLGMFHNAATAVVLASGWLLFLRVLVVLALAVLFFVLLRPAVAAPVAAATAIAGWFSGGLPPLNEITTAASVQPFATAARLILPDFAHLAPSLDDFATTPPPLAEPTLYAALYAAGVIILPLTIFPRLIRDDA